MSQAASSPGFCTLVLEVRKIIRNHPLGTMSILDYMAVWPLVIKLWTQSIQLVLGLQGKSIKANFVLLLLCVAPAEEERGVGEQEEKGGEPGHLPRTLS